MLEHRPLSLWDSEYGCARFLQLTAEIACDKLLRLHPNRVLYGPPPRYSGRGRSPKRGDKFTLKDSNSWWPCEQQRTMKDEKLGHIRVRQWSQLHFRKSPEHEMILILVERLDERGEPRQKPL